MAHLLIPTDLSERSMEAAVAGVALFGTEGNQFTLVYAYQAIALADPMVPGLIPDLHQVHVEGLEKFEARLRTQVDLSGAQVSRVAAYGPLSVLIDGIAQETDVDLVVMSLTAEHGPVLFGTDASHVMSGAHVPVLGIPEGITAPRIRRILFADDRATIAPHTLDILAALARMNHAEVIIAHVATGKSADQLTDNSAVFARTLNDIPYRTRVVEDDQVERALLTLAAEEQADMIALLHRHAGIWHSLFHASVTRSIADHSPLPVLVLEQ